jgi:hypothetical protein
MNQKQLADVLIKILGLSFGVDGVIRIFSGVISIFSEVIRNGISGIYFWTTPLTGGALVLIAFLLIVLSQTIADVMFRDE